MEYVDLIFALAYLLLGVILYPGNQHYIVTSACGSQSGGRAQVSLTMCHPNHLVATEGSAAGPMQSATSVTYSSQGPPPTYQEKEQHSHLS